MRSAAVDLVQVFPASSRTMVSLGALSPKRRRAASDCSEAKRKRAAGSRAKMKRTAPLQRLQTPSKRTTGPAILRLQRMQIWDAGLHQVQIHLHKVVLHASGLGGGEKLGPIHRALAHGPLL